METFCGQAAGAARHGVLGVVLQRGIAASAAVAVPCILVWTQAARILAAIGDLQQRRCYSLSALDRLMIANESQLALAIVKLRECRKHLILDEQAKMRSSARWRAAMSSCGRLPYCSMAASRPASGTSSPRVRFGRPLPYASMCLPISRQLFTSIVSDIAGTVGLIRQKVLCNGKI